MATQANLLAQAKKFLNIATAITTFDTELNTHLDFAIKNLSPIAMVDIEVDVTKTFAADARNVALPTGTIGVRTLELYDSDISDYRETNEYKLHAGSIWLDRPVTESTNARIFGLGYYAYSTLLQEFELPVVYWGISQFYHSLAGNRRKYNIYVGAAGASADKDMKDSADYYHDLGNEILMDRVALRGA